MVSGFLHRFPENRLFRCLSILNRPAHRAPVERIQSAGIAELQQDPSSRVDQEEADRFLDRRQSSNLRSEADGDGQLTQFLFHFREMVDDAFSR